MAKTKDELEMELAMENDESSSDLSMSDAEGSFLPSSYEVPDSGGNYMKLEKGENKFRALQSPIIGWELWVAKKPKRYPMEAVLPLEDIENADVDERTGEPRPAKHFWAMFVWNYKAKRVQVLELTQKTIQKTLKGLARSSDWGSPLGYDISIVKEGDGFETTYEVIPSPPKPLSEEVQKAWKELEEKVDITELYRSGDPFKPVVTS